MITKISFNVLWEGQRIFVIRDNDGGSFFYRVYYFYYTWVFSGFVVVNRTHRLIHKQNVNSLTVHSV